MIVMTYKYKKPSCR